MFAIVLGTLLITIEIVLRGLEVDSHRVGLHTLRKVLQELVLTSLVIESNG